MARRNLLKTFPHLAGISKYEQKYAEVFLAACPQWEAYLKMETDTYNGGTNKYLALEIPCPARPNERGLIIACYSAPLTIYFDRWHGHFYGGETYLDDTELHSEKIVDQLRQGWKLRKLTDYDYTKRLAPKTKSWLVFQSEKLIFNDAKSFADRIMSERIVIYVYMENGKGQGGVPLKCWRH